MRNSSNAKQRRLNRHQTRSDAPGICQRVAVVIAHQERIESARTAGTIATNHELLAAIRPPFDPIAGVARMVNTARSLCDNPFKPILTDHLNKCGRWCGERFRVANDFRRAVHDFAQLFAPFLQRTLCKPCRASLTGRRRKTRLASR